MGEQIQKKGLLVDGKCNIHGQEAIACTIFIGQRDNLYHLSVIRSIILKADLREREWKVVHTVFDSGRDTQSWTE